MANIPYPNPGIAEFGGENFGHEGSYLIDNTRVTTTPVAVGENVDLPFLAVVYYDGATIGLAVNGDANKAPYGILTCGVKTGAGESASVHVMRTGHFDMQSLVWDASYATDDDKRKAFEGTNSPGIFIGKRDYKGSRMNMLP